MDVDAMLESISAMQLQEWFAFFRIRNEKDGGNAQGGGYGTSKEEQRRMSGDILRGFKGYQDRRDKRKSK